jgi:hypothetical protein
MARKFSSTLVSQLLQRSQGGPSSNSMYWASLRTSFSSLMSAGECLLGAFAVIGNNVYRVVPDQVPTLDRQNVVPQACC